MPRPAPLRAPSDPAAGGPGAAAASTTLGTTVGGGPVPLRLRALAALGAAALAFVPAALLGGLVAGGLVAAGTAAFASLVPLRFAARPGTLTLAPGIVRLAAGAARSRALTAGDVLAASTARSRRGATLVLALRGADAPLELEVPRSADVDRLRRALGVGARGYGALRWTLEGGTFVRVAAGLRALAGVFAFAAAYAALRDPERALALGAAMGRALVGIAALNVLAMADAFAARASLAVHDEGVTAFDGRVTRTFAFAQLAGARAEGDDLVLDLRAAAQDPGAHPVAVRVPFGRRRAERDAARRVVDAAIARARADVGAPRARGDAVDGASEALARDLLAPTPSESEGAWRARLDAMGASLGGGYRSVPLEREAVWRVAEDPDARPELRGAAARVLLRAEPADATRARVEALVASTRLAPDRARLRVAAGLAEDDEAAAEGDASDERRRARSR